MAHLILSLSLRHKLGRCV